MGRFGGGGGGYRPSRSSGSRYVTVKSWKLGKPLV